MGSCSCLQDWKDGVGPMGRLLPKYKPYPDDDTPVVAEEPTSAICSNQDGALAIPPEIRTRYLQDPHRAPEWRRILKEFDRKWGCTETSHVQETTSPPSTEQPGGVEAPPQAATWGDIFPGEPTTKEALHNKYGQALHSFTIEGNLTAVITEGPKLFVLAAGSACSITPELPLLCFGAGTWLLDAKADTFIQAWVR